MGLAGFHNCMYGKGLGGMGSGDVLGDCLMSITLACREGLNCAFLAIRGWEVIGRGWRRAMDLISSTRSHILVLI
jgi:hypothetical protein